MHVYGVYKPRVSNLIGEPFARIYFTNSCNEDKLKIRRVHHIIRKSVFEKPRFEPKPTSNSEEFSAKIAKSF